jgi:3-mercaptopyruvate sulfurtransferase SseA
MLEFWVDPESPYYKPVFTEDKTYVLYCAADWRGVLAAATLGEMGLRNVLHLEGGFSEWKKAGRPTAPRPHHKDGKGDAGHQEPAQSTLGKVPGQSRQVSDYPNQPPKAKGVGQI